MARRPNTNFVDSYTQEVYRETVQSLDKIPVNIFLCGPGIKKKRMTRGGTSRMDIRTFIKSKLQTEMRRCDVKMGEHQGSIRAFGEAVGQRAANLADHEFALVTRKGLDLLLIFPCSPGSFAELGMFCLVADVAEKMAIFVRPRYRRSKGYVLQGPVKAAEQNNARVFFYRHRNKIWEEIRDIVLGVKARKRKRKLLRG